MSKLSDTLIDSYAGYVSDWSGEQLSDPNSVRLRAIQEVAVEASDSLDKAIYHEDAIQVAEDLSRALEEYRKLIKNYPSRSVSCEY